MNRLLFLALVILLCLSGLLNIYQYRLRKDLVNENNCKRYLYSKTVHALFHGQTINKIDSTSFNDNRFEVDYYPGSIIVTYTEKAGCSEALDVEFDSINNYLIDIYDYKP